MNPLDELQQPAEKRYRLDGMHEDAAGKNININDNREGALKVWAENTVRALQGAPSLHEAAQRCFHVLSEFETEVRNAAEQEFTSTQEEAAEPTCDEPRQQLQSLQHTNRVLVRAVHNLNDRCKRMEASAQEAEALRNALAQSQEGQRRLQHSNEILQGHLKAALDAMEGPEHWVNAMR